MVGMFPGTLYLPGNIPTDCKYKEGRFLGTLYSAREHSQGLQIECQWGGEEHRAGWGCSEALCTFLFREHPQWVKVQGQCGGDNHWRLVGMFRRILYLAVNIPTGYKYSFSMKERNMGESRNALLSREHWYHLQVQTHWGRGEICKDIGDFPWHAVLARERFQRGKVQGQWGGENNQWVFPGTLFLPENIPMVRQETE